MGVLGEGAFVKDNEAFGVSRDIHIDFLPDEMRGAHLRRNFFFKREKDLVWSISLLNQF